MRFSRRTQSFPPDEGVQASIESLWKFCSKRSTAAFSPDAKFSARRKCPRFHGEPVEIQTSQAHHVHVQWRGCICFVPLKSTLLCCHPEFLMVKRINSLPSLVPVGLHVIWPFFGLPFCLSYDSSNHRFYWIFVFLIKKNPLGLHSTTRCNELGLHTVLFTSLQRTTQLMLLMS